MKSIKVLSFQQYESSFVPGVGEVKVNVNDSSYKGIHMELMPSGVMCKLKGKRFLIPIHSCKIILLSESGEQD